MKSIAILFLLVAGSMPGSSTPAQNSSHAASSFVPAKGLHCSLDPHGVYLIWDADIANHPETVQFDYRIYRQEKGSAKKVAIPFQRGVLHQSEGERWSGVDTNIEWEKTYTYWVAPVTRLYSKEHKLISESEGESSAPVEIVVHDVFAPAAPQELLVFPSEIPDKKFIDLMWRPNVEKDLAGYNIYRREEGGKLTRLNSDLVTMLSFQDTNVIPGHKYFYAVSAVNSRGNESDKTHETPEVQP
jgi:hypothetical protein